MVVWSFPILRSGVMSQLRTGSSSVKFNYLQKYRDVSRVQVRTCKSLGGRFQIVPSTFMWNRTKDLFKFYLTLTGMPFVAIILYANIFIGPATLKPIPEGYEPKYWEYHPHPVTRFICRYLIENPQKTYEKVCYMWFYYAEKNLLRDLEKKVKFLISDRRDFQAWYYSPAFVKYTRNRLKKVQDIQETQPQMAGFPLY